MPKIASHARNGGCLVMLEAVGGALQLVAATSAVCRSHRGPAAWQLRPTGESNLILVQGRPRDQPGYRKGFKSSSVRSFAWNRQRKRTERLDSCPGNERSPRSPIVAIA